MSSFKEDIERGETGEFYFECLYKLIKSERQNEDNPEHYKNEWGIKDLRKNPQARLNDIDYIELSKGYTEEDFFKEGVYNNRSPYNIKEVAKFAVPIEIKTDYYAAISKNLAFEIWSHGRDGCWVLTNAHKWIFIVIDEKTGIFLNAYCVDVPKMKAHMAKYAYNDWYQDREKYGFSFKRSKKEDSVLITGKIDKLLEYVGLTGDKIIIDITKKVKEAIEKYGTTCEETNS